MNGSGRLEDVIMQEPEGRRFDGASGLGDDDGKPVKLGQDLGSRQERRPGGEDGCFHHRMPGAVETQEISYSALGESLDAEPGAVRPVIDVRDAELVITTGSAENPAGDQTGGTQLGAGTSGSPIAVWASSRTSSVT